MKKLTTLFVAFAMVSLSASAQEVNFKSKRGEYMLPEKGDWALGFNADGVFKYVGNAFNNSGNSAPSVTNLKEGKFVGKKFITDKKAWRVVASFEVGTEKKNWGKDFDSTRSTFALAAGLGKEWRRGKTRLQGFYGVDAMIGVHTNSYKAVNGSSTTKFSNGLGFDINATSFTGAEYFIFPKIAIGAQYEFGLNLAIESKQKTTVNGTESAQTAPSGARTGVSLGGVSVASMSVFLHF